jgi:hypothetical protein
MYMSTFGICAFHCLAIKWVLIIILIFAQNFFFHALPCAQSWFSRTSVSAPHEHLHSLGATLIMGSAAAAARNNFSLMEAASTDADDDDEAAAASSSPMEA